MSVDYKLVCHNHEESVSICSDGFSGPLLQVDKALSHFCITHRGCDLMVAEEQSYAFDEYDEWTKENCGDRFRYDLND